MADFFDTIQDKARRQGVQGTSREAREWFRKKMREVGRKASVDDIIKMREKATTKPSPGKMYFYKYDPKTKDTLPYYDTFPLTVVVEPYSDGFLGLNLHYLPPKQRGLFLSKLMEYSNDGSFQVTYNFLQSVSRLKEYKACLKRYLTSHMKTPAIEVEEEDWLPAVFLPVAKFKGSSKSAVWSDSTQKY